MDGRKLRTGTVHTKQLVGTWRRTDAKGLHHGIEETGRKTNARNGLRLVQDTSEGGSCSSFIEIATETLCETWSESETETLTDWKNWDALDPLLLETVNAHKMAETMVMTVTELELKTLLQKKREGQHLERAELNRLCRAIWRNRRALKREKHLTKIKECRDWETLQENTKQAFQLEFGCKKNPETIPTSFFQDFHSIPADQLELVQAERTHWIELWRNLRVDCAGGTLISIKKLKSVLSKLKYGMEHQTRSQRTS